MLAENQTSFARQGVPTLSPTLAPRPSPLAPADAVLLVGHGTRDPAGVAEFLLLAERVRGLLLPLPLEACFLELAQPTIADGLNRLIGFGARRVTVVPLLLTAAGHAKRDIPGAIAEVSGVHPELVVRQTAALDCHPRIVDLSTRRYDEALADGRSCRRSKRCCCWSDAAVPIPQRLQPSVALPRCGPSGRRSAAWKPVLRRSPSRRWRKCCRSWRRPGFGGLSCSRICCFAGGCLADIRDAVERFQTRETASEGRARTEWIVAGPLGPEAELAEAVVDLVRALRRAELRK